MSGGLVVSHAREGGKTFRHEAAGRSACAPRTTAAMRLCEEPRLRAGGRTFGKEVSACPALPTT